MSPAVEVTIAIILPVAIVCLFAIEPTSILVAYWIAREQRRRDIAAGVEPPNEECEP